MADETHNNDPESLEPTGEGRDQIGPHEVVAPFGAGGMGEVYRARDTKLGREMAIELPPEHRAESPERKLRLREREARAISQLNHRHICTLYDLRQFSESRRRQIGGG